MRVIQLDSKLVGEPNAKPYIIAEIGTNHDQKKDQAIKLINEISKSRCDCIKFQIYEPYEIVSKRVKCSEYGLDKFYGDISAYDMFEKHLKTPKSWFPELLDYVHSLGMDCMATIHGENGIEWASDLAFDLIKVASMDHSNTPFLQTLTDKIDKPLLVSFGMADLESIDTAMGILKKNSKGLGIFYCSAVYPPGPEDVSLGNISYMRERYQVPVGFSDHTLGTATAVAALACGARIFEKHVTLDRALLGPDHTSAATVREFQEYVETLVVNKNFLNEEFRNPSKNEIKNKQQYLKSVISKVELKSGDKIKQHDIYLARPGTGIEPKYFYDLIGRVLRNDIEAEVPIKWSDLLEK